MEFCVLYQPPKYNHLYSTKSFDTNSTKYNFSSLSNSISTIENGENYLRRILKYNLLKSSHKFKQSASTDYLKPLITDRAKNWMNIFLIKNILGTLHLM